MGSLILKADSPYKMWYAPLLNGYDVTSNKSVTTEHYIRVNKDLSNVASVIDWCRKNDDKCQKIVQNALAFKRNISSSYMVSYMANIFNTLSGVEKNDTSPDENNPTQKLVTEEEEDTGDDYKIKPPSTAVSDKNKTSVNPNTTSVHNFVVKQGDLLEATEEYIAHQCNTKSKRGGGLSADMFKKYPEANDYKRRTYGKLGTIKVHRISNENRVVVNMFAQKNPGIKNKIQENMNAFVNCLQEIRALNITEIAFPFNIGCGIAGGSWPKYKKMLIEHLSNHDIKVVVYNLLKQTIIRNKKNNRLKTMI